MIERESLLPLLNTLRCIEVRGKDNLEKLLGSIMYLERLTKTDGGETVERND